MIATGKMPIPLGGETGHALRLCRTPTELVNARGCRDDSCGLYGYRQRGPTSSGLRSSTSASLGQQDDLTTSHALTDDARAVGWTLRHAASISSRSSLTGTRVEAASITASA